MKKTILIPLGLFLILIGIYVWQRNSSATQTYQNNVANQTATSTGTGSNILMKGFVSADGSITFNYPNALMVSQSNNVITLHHQINFSNHDACDFKGTGGTSPTLTDFNVTMQKFNLTIASTAAVFDSSLASTSENTDGTLDISAGTIDPYNIGPFNGYKVTEGVEGCGYITYYLPISNSKTLVVQKQMIGALSDVADPINKAKILSTSGAISPDQSNTIFNGITSSLQIR